MPLIGSNNHSCELSQRWSLAVLFSWQGKIRRVLSVVICTSREIPSCPSAQRPDEGTACQTASLLPLRASPELGRKITSPCNLPSLISLPSPLQQRQRFPRQFQTAEGSRPMERTRQELGLELVPKKGFRRSLSVSVLCSVKQYLLHFMSLSKPPHTPLLLPLCYDHTADIWDKKAFSSVTELFYYLKCY